MSQVFTFPYVPGWVKYVVISALGGVSSLVLFLQSPPAGGATAASTAVFLLGLFVHDIEGYNPNAPPTTQQITAQGAATWTTIKPLLQNEILALPKEDQAVAKTLIDTIDVLAAQATPKA
jgi:hypothetical protein